MREMKASGVEWLGEVPAGWELHRAKHLFKLTNGRGNDDLTLLAATQKHGMWPQDRLDGVVRVKDDSDLSKFRTVHKNDYVISLRSFQGGFERSDFEGVCSPAYQTFCAIKPIDYQYFKYLFKSPSFIDHMNSLTLGIREGKTIKFDDFATQALAVPPLDEQRRIADFLDEKCDEIDCAVSAAEQSIEEYKVYKNSIVFQAVTRGLDPDIPMADSGLDWIGSAPKHWDVLEQKWLMRKEKSICENWQGESVLSLTTGGVIVRDVESGKGKFPATFDGYQYIDAGNLVLCLFDIDVTPRCVGLAKQAGVISPAYSQFVMLPGAEARFYDYYFRAMDDRKLYLGLTSTMRHSFTADAFGLIHALRPPVDEQLRIANYLDTKTIEIDRLVSSKQAIIADLKAYKQSLIYEAVTGKREV